MAAEYTSQPALHPGPDPRHAGLEGAPRTAATAAAVCGHHPGTRHSKAALAFQFLVQKSSSIPQGTRPAGQSPLLLVSTLAPALHTPLIFLSGYMEQTSQHYVMLPSFTPEGMAVMTLPFLPRTRKFLNSWSEFKFLHHRTMPCPALSGSTSRLCALQWAGSSLSPFYTNTTPRGSLLLCSALIQWHVGAGWLWPSQTSLEGSACVGSQGHRTEFHSGPEAWITAHSCTPLSLWFVGCA